MLSALGVAMRPHGAPRWDAAGVMAALVRVQQLHLVDVVRAVVNAAEDRELRTPGAIGNPGAPCWRDRRPEQGKATVVRDRGPWCQICGVTRTKHPEAGDHPFEGRAPNRDPDTTHRIVDSLREQVPR